MWPNEKCQSHIEIFGWGQWTRHDNMLLTLVTRVATQNTFYFRKKIEFHSV